MPPSRLSPVDSAPETAYDHTGRGAPTMQDVRVTRVTDHGWRVSDDRLPQGDPLRLLAFVEQRDDRFEVMQLGSGFQWHEFDSMDAAVAFVLRTGPRIAQERMTGGPSRREAASWAP